MTQKILQLKDVESLDLLKLSLKVTDAYSKDKTSVSGAVFAHLAKQLLANEIKPGGPYKSHTKETMPELNATIGRLFILMGQPLPNIDEHLKSLHPNDLSVAGLIAIKLYDTARKEAEKRQSPPNESDRIYEIARATLMRTEEPIRTHALKFLARVHSADTTHEIALISRFTADALHAEISDEALDKLGEANVHTWIAYMIYDHIIDGEANSEYLPVANICMRLALERYRQLAPPKDPLQKCISEYFDQVDTANGWELAHARFKVGKTRIHIQEFPDYIDNEILARRSAIHILGPIIVATRYSSLSSNKPKLERLTSGLRQYLIARQLSDDIHDWREDLAAGQISAVVVKLLKDYGTQVSTTHNLDELTSALQHIFLHETSQSISKVIIAHAHRSAKSLRQAGCTPSSELTQLVLRIESMAKASIQQQSRFLEFQSEYQDGTTSRLTESGQE